VIFSFSTGYTQEETKRNQTRPGIKLPAKIRLLWSWELLWPKQLQRSVMPH